MRPVRLAQIAVEAEGVRLRAMAKRTAIRAGMGALAVIFLLGVLIFLHVIIWLWLRTSLYWDPIPTAVVLLILDLVIAAVLGFLALRSTPSRVEIEAREVRQRAWQNLLSTVAITTALVPALRLGVRMLRGARRERV